MFEYDDRDLVGILAHAKDLWSGFLHPLEDGAFTAGCQISLLTGALAEAIGLPDLDGLVHLNAACCFFSDAIVLADNVIDNESPSNGARDVPRLLALFSESYRIFGALFATDADFWRHHRRYFVEYLHAMEVERQIATGERTWSSIDLVECLNLARGKNGLARLTAAGVCALAKDFTDLDVLENAIMAYFVSGQMLDDVRDWREDVTVGNVSLLLRRAVTEKPTTGDLDTLRVRLHLEGHVNYVLGLGSEIANEAIAKLPGSAHRISTLLGRTAKYLDSLHESLEETRQAQLAQAPNSH